MENRLCTKGRGRGSRHILSYSISGRGENLQKEIRHEKQELNLQAMTNGNVKTVGDYSFEPIRGQPMLHWAGKRPFALTQFYPAQAAWDGTARNVKSSSTWPAA